MENFKAKLLLIGLFLGCFIFCQQVMAQSTQIRGFVETSTTIQDGKLSFGFGEQDLFITSELNDHFSFLGESVFKYSGSSPTHFDVAIERIVIKYNYKGNHNLLIGKHHTPINYWNDTYHHGRVFFPTIDRPLLFAAGIIPIHTTGLALQGLNLGKLKFGYNILMGNGIGSTDVEDNDKTKSITASIHLKPIDKLQVGFSYYKDAISSGAEVNGNLIAEKINQQLFTGTVSYFGRNFEVLAEGTYASNKANSTGSISTLASYVYAGYKIKENWIPYLRIDRLDFDDEELLFGNDDTTSYVFGLRHEINYLTVVKMEYQHHNREISGSNNKLTTQIAIGF